ncbi:MAG: hypothetical protein KDD64_07035, partial [Bdellovibrionales bacterium]|nr:hypothetical protein [Bdellovibrionales bacterium]
GYGYEGEALFRTKFLVPEDAPLGSSIKLSAKATYLMCSAKLCVPGRKLMSFELPVSAQTVPADSGEFERWTERFPTEMNSNEKSVSSSGGFSSPDANKGSLMVSFSWVEGRPSDRFQIFAAVPDRTILLKEVSRLVSEKGLEVEYEITRNPSTKRQTQELEIVLVPLDGPKQGRGFVTSVPLPS